MLDLSSSSTTTSTSSHHHQFISPPPLGLASDSRSCSPISYIDDDSDIEQEDIMMKPDPASKANTQSSPTSSTIPPELTRTSSGGTCCTKKGCVLKDVHPTKLLPPHHRHDHADDNTAIITLPSLSKQAKGSMSVSSGFSRLPQLDDDAQGTTPSQSNSTRNRNQNGDDDRTKEVNGYHISDPSTTSTFVGAEAHPPPPPPLTFPAVIKAVRHSEHPTHEGRSLVLCFDGTGDQFDGDNSNVVKFFACLRKNDKRRQLVYYQAGIGTYLHTQYSIPGMKTLSKMADLAVAHSIATHIKGGYHFLQENFTIGDRIILLGFSRGAYTARALAGMLHKVGLLAKGNMEQLPFAYKLYQDSSAHGFSMSREFKRTFSMDVRVHFMGCWDSVSSVGFFRSGNSFPFDSGDSTVAYFRHAMALDERRAKFKVGRWERFEAMMERLKMKAEKKAKKIADEIGTAGADALGHNNENELSAKGSGFEGEVGSSDGKGKFWADRPSSSGAYFASSPMTTPTASKGFGTTQNHHPKKEESTSDDMDDKIFPSGYLSSEWGNEQEAIEAELAAAEEPESRLKPQNQVSEVWFPGCHCDVGGGAVRNDVSHSLSKIPLRWMIRQTFKCNTGIIYDSASLAALGLDLTTLYPFVKKRKEMISEPPTDLPHIVQSISQPNQKTSDLGLESGMGGSSLEELIPRSPDVYLGEGNNYEAMTEEEHDYVDSLEGINDELNNRKGWYILEVLPVAQENYHPPTQTWFQTMGPNLGRPRVILDNRPKLHRSIITRQEKLGYSIKALTPDHGRDVKLRYVE